MKLMHTVAKVPYELANVKVKRGALEFTVDGRPLRIDQDTIAEFIGANEASEINSLYIFNTDRGLVLRNKMAETAESKRDGARYLRAIRLGQNLGQIYLPFSTLSLTDAVVRLNVSEESLAKSGLEGTDRVENRHDAYVALSESIFPSLAVDQHWRDADGNHHMDVQVMRKGRPLRRAGMKVYAKTDAGYLNRRYAYTDEKGLVTFRFAGMLLDPGEKATLKFGFRNFSNVASIEVVV